MQEPVDQPSDGRMRLPVGTVLDSLYDIEGVLGAGGFGITYKGRDRQIGRLVAIKEYFPVDYSSRDQTLEVKPFTGEQRNIFSWGIARFLDEAKLLAGFAHPGIVGVLRYFEANGTAYMVLDHIAGQSLRDWAGKLGRPPTQAEMDRITGGLCDALKEVHSRRLVHRDIAPDNIIIRPDGSPVLLDFGAARYEFVEKSRARGNTTGSIAIAKRNYSPLEAHVAERSRRGAWSDIYSLGATLYKAATGVTPADALDRVAADRDPVAPAAKVARGTFRPGFLAAIDHALQLKYVDRPQTIEAFRELAFADEAGAKRKIERPSGIEPAASEPKPVLVQPRPEPKSSGEIADHRPRPQPTTARRYPLAAVLVALAAMVAITAGIGALRRGGGPVVQPPGSNLPPPDWVTLRNAAGAEVDQASIMLTAVSQAMQRADWVAARRQANEAERQIGTARQTVSRLQATAERDDDRRFATQYAARLDQMLQTLTEMRRGIVAGDRPPTPTSPPVPPPVTKAPVAGPVLPPAQPPPPAVTPPPAPVRTVSLWNHNGSIMRLVSEGTRRQFFYDKPTDRMEKAGARRGTLLFEGERRGDAYSGTARLFNSSCGPHPYTVSGTVSANQRQIVMRGAATRLDRSTCQPSERFEDVLVFELIEGPAAPAVKGFHVEIKSGTYALQVIATYSEIEARARIVQVRELLREVLLSVKDIVREEDEPQGFRFKARFIGLDEASARRLCDLLEQVEGRRDCFIRQGW